MSNFCALGDNCEEFDRRHEIPGLTDGFNLCPTCTNRCRGDVSALVFDYVDLSQLIARRAGLSDALIARPKPQSTPPIDVEIVTLRSDIAMTLVSCEVVLRQALRLPARDNRHVREGFNVEQAVAVVSRHVDTLAALALPGFFDDEQGVGADALLLLRSLHRRARRVAGLAELTIALPGYCEGCGVAALSRRDGSDTVTCRACAHAQPWPAYQRRVTLVVTHIDPVLSVTGPRLTGNDRESAVRNDQEKER